MSSLQPPPAGGLNTQTLATNIRHWVHYNSILEDLQKQTKNARESRNAHEQQILTMLRASSLQNPVIQVGGGRLLVAHERQQQALSFKSLEDCLHQYYAAKAPGARDETSEILKFIRAHRTSTSTTHDVLRFQRVATTPRVKDGNTTT